MQRFVLDEENAAGTENRPSETPRAPQLYERTRCGPAIERGDPDSTLFSGNGYESYERTVGRDVVVLDQGIFEEPLAFARCQIADPQLSADPGVGANPRPKQVIQSRAVARQLWLI